MQKKASGCPSTGRLQTRTPAVSPLRKSEKQTSVRVLAHILGAEHARVRVGEAARSPLGAHLNAASVGQGQNGEQRRGQGPENLNCKLVSSEVSTVYESTIQRTFKIDTGNDTLGVCFQTHWKMLLGLEKHGSCGTARPAPRPRKSHSNTVHLHPAALCLRWTNSWRFCLAQMRSMSRSKL